MSRLQWLGLQHAYTGSNSFGHAGIRFNSSAYCMSGHRHMRHAITWGSSPSIASRGTKTQWVAFPSTSVFSTAWHKVCSWASFSFLASAQNNGYMVPKSSMLPLELPQQFIKELVSCPATHLRPYDSGYFMWCWWCRSSRLDEAGDVGLTRRPHSRFWFFFRWKNMGGQKMHR